jgi:hypothetical protein
VEGDHLCRGNTIRAWVRSFMVWVYDVHLCSSWLSDQRCTMRFILIFFLAVVFGSPTHAAAPTKAARPAPVNLNIRTAGDLADACTTRPADRVGFARLNFCNGFAQGIIQTNSQNPNGTKICISNPSPKRSETMKEFAGWVSADATRKDELASVAFLRFMAGQFSCP